MSHPVTGWCTIIIELREMNQELHIARQLSKNKFNKVYQERPYQQRVINKVVNDWYGNNDYHVKIKSGLIELPPGAGKTVIALKLAKMFKEQAREINGWDPKDVGIGWVVGRRNLLQQAKNENDIMIQCPDIHYISQFSNNVKDHEINRFKHKLMVIDEAHHEACDSIHNVINVIDPEYVIGLSATPNRTDNAKLCFQKTYKDAGFYTLIDEGWLSQFDQWMIPDWSPKSVINTYVNEIDKWGKSVIFFLNREQCDEAMTYLSEAGVKASLVTGQTDREAQIDEFEKGDVNVLVNMYVLTEGFDFSGMKSVFVRDSGQLPTIQMAGRVLRPHPDVPVSNIVQSTKTKWPFIRTANIANHVCTWENGWKYINKNDLIDKTACNMIKQLAVADVDNETLDLLKNMGRKRKRRVV
jgi:superfamily II DNA or RNA helicase